jgi:hypothetical protein
MLCITIAQVYPMPIAAPSPAPLETWKTLFRDRKLHAARAARKRQGIKWGSNGFDGMPLADVAKFEEALTETLA